VSLKPRKVNAAKANVAKVSAEKSNSQRPSSTGINIDADTLDLSVN